MKKIYFIIIALLAGLTTFNSCDYLDVVPDEAANEKDAFKDAEAARRYLYSCYSYLPDPRHQTESIDFLTSDETVTAFEHETFSRFPQGNYTPVNPIISYWNTLFQGIRQCYLLLDNIDGVPNMPDSDKRVYKAEATFLIAYYHFLLAKCYGPTLIFEGAADINMSVNDYPARRPYDECIQWIADKFDEAIALGLVSNHIGTSYGRATSTAALAMKSRMLLYAASPLFNGGRTNYADAEANDLSSTFANFKNLDGTQLISTTYDPSKWQRAADAALAAINAANDAGNRLYVSTDVPSNLAEPTDPTERALRMTITDRNTKEIIWAETRQENYYSLQLKSTPWNATGGVSANGVAPTLTMLETFYSANGLPIKEDPAFDYANAYNYSAQTELRHGQGVTLNLNMNREPRFYAWIAYHNSYYEVLSYASDPPVSSGEKSKMLVSFRRDDNCGTKGRTNNYAPTGYLNKKGVHPSYSRPAAGQKEQYPWPLIRVAELYLNYAEALIEVGGESNIQTAKEYIDRVRERAGLPKLDVAWAVTGKTLDQNRMRQIVRQERTIELYLENHRFWDVRRWLLGEKYFNVKAKGMNINQSTDVGFFNVVDVNFTRVFRVPQHYLMPIPIGDIDINEKLLQNPGY